MPKLKLCRRSFVWKETIEKMEIGVPSVVRYSGRDNRLGGIREAARRRGLRVSVKQIKPRFRKYSVTLLQ